MNTALYRRYRPESFQDVIGQDHVTEPLMAALRADRTTHAYLFSGPRGCGKTTSARILARCLNCAEGPTDTPCGSCESCRELSSQGSGSLDVVEMDAASHGGVDDARELRERAGFAPVRDRFKVFIIDEAHMVSTQGFNALLKLVEEPPEHVKFIFATTEPGKVIGTIRSRTHHYPFRLVPPEILESYLASLCEREGVETEPGVLPLVVRAGTGSVRDSLSVLDQLMGGTDSGKLEYSTSVALLGYTDATLLDDAIEAIAAMDGATLLAVVERLVQSGHDPRRFVEDLLMRLRDLVIITLAGDQAGDVLGSMPKDQYERMLLQAQHLGPARASQCADLVNNALTLMVGATSPRLQLELLCGRLLMSSARAAAPSEAPAKPGVDPREEARARFARQKKSDDDDEGPTPPSNPTEAPKKADPVPSQKPSPESAKPERLVPEAAPEAKAEPTPEPVAEPAPEPAAEREPEPLPEPAPGPSPQHDSAMPDAMMVRQRWQEILGELDGRYRATSAMLKQAATVGAVTDGSLSLYFDNEGMASSFGRRQHPDRLKEVLRDRLGLDLELDIRVGKPEAMPQPSQHSPQRSAQQRSAEPDSADDAEGDSAPPRAEPAPSSAPSAEPRREFTVDDIPDDEAPEDGGAPAPAPEPTPEPEPAPTSTFFTQDLPPAPPRDFPMPGAGQPADGLAGASATLSPIARLQRERMSPNSPAMGVSPEDDEDELGDDWSAVSDDDPIAHNSREVGVAVVVDILKGTVLEQIPRGSEKA